MRVGAADGEVGVGRMVCWWTWVWLWVGHEAVGYAVLGEERRSVQWSAGWGPPQLGTRHTWDRGQLSLEHVPRLKLWQISLPWERVAVRLGPAGVARGFLAGPLVYKGHACVLCVASRQRVQRVLVRDLPGPVNATA